MKLLNWIDDNVVALDSLGAFLFYGAIMAVIGTLGALLARQL